MCFKVHKNIIRFRGRAIKSTGGGFLATFDGPARAIRCASMACEEAKQIGIEIRAGLHTGEIELIGEDIGGIAVHIASRVLGQAGDNKVWVQQPVILEWEIRPGVRLSLSPTAGVHVRASRGESHFGGHRLRNSRNT